MNKGGNFYFQLIPFSFSSGGHGYFYQITDWKNCFLVPDHNSGQPLDLGIFRLREKNETTPKGG